MALVVRREQFSRLVIGRQRLHTLSTTFGTWHTHRHTRTGGRGTQLSLPHPILLLLPRRLPHHYFIGTGKKKKSTVPQIIWLNCRRGDLYNARQCRRRRKGHPLLLFHLSMRLTTFYSFSLWVFLILLLLFVFFLSFLICGAGLHFHMVSSSKRGIFYAHIAPSATHEPWGGDRNSRPLLHTHTWYQGT